MKIGFPQNLKKLRKKMGLSQEELSLSLKLSKGAVSQYESARNYPNMETMLRLCELFDVSLDELILDSVAYNTKSKHSSIEETGELLEQYSKDKDVNLPGLLGHFVSAESKKEIEYLTKTVAMQEREINTMRSYTARLEKELEKCEDSLRKGGGKFEQTG